jgi:hypothetical protein
MRDLIARTGLTVPECRRSVWVHGEGPLEFHVARGLIQSIIASRPHVRLIVTSSRPETLEFLRSVYLDELVLPTPLGMATRRWLRRLQVRHALFLEGGRSLPPGVPPLLSRLKIAVSAVGVAAPTEVAPTFLEAARHGRRVYFCAVDEGAAAALMNRGVPHALIAITGRLHDDPPAGPPIPVLRRTLDLPPEVPLLAALDLPQSEVIAVLDSFAAARRCRPELRMLLGPRGGRRLKALAEVLRSRGWAIAMAGPVGRPNGGPWDVMIATNPGTASVLLPAAEAALVGGSLSSGPSVEVSAIASAAGVPMIEGRDRLELGMPEILGRAILETLDRDKRPVLPQSAGDTAAERIAAALTPLLPDGPSLPPVAQDWRIPTWRDRVGSSWAWRSIATRLTRGRIDSWDELRARIGHPRVMLCLGNGPSSEDPRLATIRHDCLIRVNWRWKQRSPYQNPQIIFVGDPRTISKVRGAVFGLWDRALEDGMLLRHLVVRGLRPMCYFTMERISPLIRDREWPARPTNGALMVAAAVALRPDRLVIAGVDLYDDPAGRYPGDLMATNACGRAHTRATDLAIIRAALAEYHGERLVLGHTLRAALAEAPGDSP